MQSDDVPKSGKSIKFDISVTPQIRINHFHLIQMI